MTKINGNLFQWNTRRGKPKPDHCDLIQLCAQAMCLEEMLSVSVPNGAIFYGRTRRRTDVTFDDGLRRETEEAAEQSPSVDLFRNDTSAGIWKAL